MPLRAATGRFDRRTCRSRNAAPTESPRYRGAHLAMVGERLMGFRKFSEGVVRVAVAVLCAAAMTAKEARATDDYPNGALRIVVGFAPGGSSDTAARLVGERLSKRLGQ